MAGQAQIADVERFISEVENRLYIWNYRLEGHHKNRKKSLEEVGEMFDVTGTRR